MKKSTRDGGGVNGSTIGLNDSVIIKKFHSLWDKLIFRVDPKMPIAELAMFTRAARENSPSFRNKASMAITAGNGKKAFEFRVVASDLMGGSAISSSPISKLAVSSHPPGVSFVADGDDDGMCLTARNGLH